MSACQDRGFVLAFEASKHIEERAQRSPREAIGTAQGRSAGLLIFCTDDVNHNDLQGRVRPGPGEGAVNDRFVAKGSTELYEAVPGVAGPAAHVL